MEANCMSRLSCLTMSKAFKKSKDTKQAYGSHLTVSSTWLVGAVSTVMVHR